jgi:hypothetical protein
MHAPLDVPHSERALNFRSGEALALCSYVRALLICWSERREAATPEFAAQLSALLCDELKLPRWSSLPASTVTGLSVTNIAAALTNKIYRVSAPNNAAPSVLLRLYGASSDELICREEEMRVLHSLSSRNQIGARILGTFTNGTGNLTSPRCMWGLG